MGVEIIEVDLFHVQPAQARLHRLARRDPSTVALTMRELARDDEAVAPAPDCPAQQFLVMPVAVSRGSIEEGDAEVDRPVQRTDRVRFIRLPIDMGQAHRTESLRAYFQRSDRCHVSSPIPITDV
jgi:hypothetical protein